MIALTTIVAAPIAFAVLTVAAARGRASRQGEKVPLRRAVLVVVIAGGIGAIVAALALLALNALSPT